MMRWYARSMRTSSSRAAKGKRHEQYEEALRLAPESTEINYAAGLYYLEIGDLERAKASAEIAYGNGYPLPGLRKKIAAAESAARRK